MVPSREGPSHQRVGTDSSCISSADIRQKQSKNVETHPPENGQCLSTDICFLHGGDLFSRSDESGVHTLGLVPTTGNHPVSIPPTGARQHNCGLGIKGCADDSRVEIPQGAVHTSQEVLATLQHGPFASQLNHQLSSYISWRPDLGVMSTNTFQSSWINLEGYAFPPFALIGRCLQKIKVEKSTVVLIAPTWQNQPWFPVLLEMLIEPLILLPWRKDMLTDPGSSYTH